MQKDLDTQVWENKDIRSARQSAVKASGGLVESFVNAGFYKDKAEALDDFHAFKNMVFDYIYAEMKPHIKADFATPTQNERPINSIAECCGSCGKPLSEKTLEWQKKNKKIIEEDERNAWCYPCKKEAGLISE